MATKKTTLTTSPLHKPASTTNLSAEAWVKTRTLEVAAEPTKRLTLDIPASLHGRIKSQCALDGKKMVEEITVLLNKKWPAP